VRSRKLPGLMKFGNLTLRRGVTQSSELFNWWRKVATGVPDRRNIAVILLDAQQQPVKQWRIMGALAVRYAVSPLLTEGEAAALIETLECAVEDFDTA
jgi:phage tail-like protein